MIENEFKMMLTSGQYEKLCGEFTWDETVLQTNYYYDTDELTLSGRRITVRVREIDGEFFLQVKLPTKTEFSRVELERRLDNLPETLSGEVLKQMSGEDMPDVKRLGKLFTKRLVKRFDGGEIDLDLSEYFEKRDFEIEIEFTDEIKAREILDKVKVIIGDKSENIVCTGKVRRFLGEYSKNSKGN